METWEEFLSPIAISLSSWRLSDLLAIAGSKLGAKFPWLMSIAITHHLRKHHILLTHDLFAGGQKFEEDNQTEK